MRNEQHTQCDAALQHGITSCVRGAHHTFIVAQEAVHTHRYFECAPVTPFARQPAQQTESTGSCGVGGRRPVFARTTHHGLAEIAIRQPAAR